MSSTLCILLRKNFVNIWQNLDVRTVDELVGRSDLLKVREGLDEREQKDRFIFYIK